MGTSILMLALVALCAGTVLGGPPRGKPHYDPARASEYFEQFVADYERQYESEQEKQRRLAIFTENLAAINERNKRDEALHGITKFTDMEVSEFKNMYLGYKQSYGVQCVSHNSSTIQVNNSSEDSWDWRTKNAVTEVKDQQRCGSCWAFSTIGNVEGQLAIKHQSLVSLSVQELLECDKVDGGCGGGLMTDALKELQRIGGVMSEADYPYEYKNIQKCRFTQSKSKVKVTGCTSFLKGLTEEKLKGILKDTGPLSIAIDGNSLQDYQGGILTNCESDYIDHGVLLVGYGTAINGKAVHPYTGGMMEDCNGDKNNHAVLLVGYGNENGTPFWIVKNSWGTRWLEDGYYRVKMGINGCGMLNYMVASAIVG